jgi:hypothetical protein
VVRGRPGPAHSHADVRWDLTNGVWIGMHTPSPMGLDHIRFVVPPSGPDPLGCTRHLAQRATPYVAPLLGRSEASPDTSRPARASATRPTHACCRNHNSRNTDRRFLSFVREVGEHITRGTHRLSNPIATCRSRAPRFGGYPPGNCGRGKPGWRPVS